MIINEAYLKEKLKNVYWLNGGPCSGKTTMSKMFVKELGFQKVEDDIVKYRLYTNAQKHPNLQYPNPNLDWDKWFNRPLDEYKDWLNNLGKEILEFYVLDLLELDLNKPIIVDLGILPEDILGFIDKSHIICLHTDPQEIHRLYYYRDDHKMILDCINQNTKNPKETIKNSCNVLVSFSEDIINSCQKQGIYCLERTKDLSIQEQFEIIKNHFNI